MVCAVPVPGVHGGAGLEVREEEQGGLGREWGHRKVRCRRWRVDRSREPREDMGVYREQRRDLSSHSSSRGGFKETRVKTHYRAEESGCLPDLGPGHLVAGRQRNSVRL